MKTTIEQTNIASAQCGGFTLHWIRSLPKPLRACDQRKPKRRLVGTLQSLAAVLLCALVLPTRGQLTIPGADGSDGTFAPTTNTVVDLSQAVTAAWDTPSPTPGKGVYDPAKWAVVFKYASIASGRTITFNNHRSRAPVVWLVNGDVTINGTVNLNGQSGGVANQTEPGPGGFRGGIGRLSFPQTPEGGGFGLGGAGIFANSDINGGVSNGSYATKGSGMSYAGPTYGNSQILPLIGGSGGAGDYPAVTGSGGAAGGAILVAASGTMSLNGTLVANGGQGVAHTFGSSGAGSGGAIRLIANRVVGSGILRAIGGPSRVGNGGDGRIRIEALSFVNGLDIIPATVAVVPDNPPLIWAPAISPTARVLAVTGRTVPIDPESNLGVAGADVTATNATNVVIEVETSNVATNGVVTVRIVPKFGQSSTATAAYVSGDATLAIWRAQATIPKGFCAIQARAVTP